MKLSKCQSDKERRRVEDCELAAINAIPLASVNIALCAQATTPASNAGEKIDSPHVPVTLAKADTRPVIRVWGARTFQPASENSAQAQEYWSEVAALELKKQIRVNLNNPTSHEAVLAELRQLHPGAGPGVPPHMPLSYDNIPDKIVSISCGESFFVALTVKGEVFIVGHGLNGELGLGPKVGALRVPKKIEFRETENTVQDDSQIKEHTLGDDEVANFTVIDEGYVKPSEVLGGLQEATCIDLICAGSHHALALSRTGELFVWGHSMACGLMSVDHILWPTSMKRFSPALKGRKIIALAAQGTKSAIVADDGTLLIWGCWPGSAPLIRPTEIAKMNSDEFALLSTSISLGDTMGLILVRFADTPNKTFMYQMGVGVRNEILGIDHSSDDPEIPTFTRICEERYNMYLPELISCYLHDHAGVPCHDILDVAVGDRHVLVLTSDNRLLAWGDNTWGQCGIAGEYKTHVAEPTAVELKSDMLPVKISAGGNQSALIGDNGAVYVWGCTRDHRLANSGIKLLAEVPVRALNDSKPGQASLSRASTIGTSTQVSIKDSVFQPERLLALASMSCTAVGMGDNYTVVATGGQEVSI